MVEDMVQQVELPSTRGSLRDFRSQAELLLDERNGGLEFQSICQQSRIRVLQLEASLYDSSRGQGRMMFSDDQGPSICTHRSTGHNGVRSTRSRV